MTLHQSELSMDPDISCLALFGRSAASKRQAVQIYKNGRKSEFPVEGEKSFSQILPDGNGHVWLVPWTEQLSETTEIHVYSEEGSPVGLLEVVGRPQLHSYGDYLFAGCEGLDGVSRIYQFTRQDQKLKREWKMDGFVWGLYWKDDLLYATCYLPDDNLAVLYVYGEQVEAAIELGENFFPTDLFYRNETFYVSACPVMGREKGRIIQLDETFLSIREFPVQTPPRRIYANETDLVVYGRELVSGRKEKLIYCNLESGQRREYSIPNVYKIKSLDERLLLACPETNALIEWDSRKRKLTEKHPLPEYEKRPLIDFHLYR